MTLMTKYGIVGSRRYTNRSLIEKMIDTFDYDDVVISGGCKGVDRWAVSHARKRGLKTLVFLPKLKKAKTHYDYCHAYYNRNALIAQHSDILCAFVMSDRKGGTENTIGWARKFNKRIWTHIEDIAKPKPKKKTYKPMTLFDGVADN